MFTIINYFILIFTLSGNNVLKITSSRLVLNILVFFKISSYMCMFTIINYYMYASNIHHPIPV